MMTMEEFLNDTANYYNESPEKFDTFEGEKSDLRLKMSFSYKNIEKVWLRSDKV